MRLYRIIPSTPSSGTLAILASIALVAVAGCRRPAAARPQVQANAAPFTGVYEAEIPDYLGEHEAVETLTFAGDGLYHKQLHEGTRSDGCEVGVFEIASDTITLIPSYRGINPSASKQVLKQVRWGEQLLLVNVKYLEEFLESPEADADYFVRTGDEVKPRSGAPVVLTDLVSTPLE